MHRSKIEWVLNPDNETLGWVWNPLTGCLNHVNGLCKGGGFPCYAYRLAHGRLKERYLANHNMVSFENIEDENGSDHWQFHDPFYPRFWPERLGEITNKLRRWGRNKIVHTHEPRGVFVCDMSDLFGIGIPEEWTRRVLEKMQYAKQDRFYLLTKQPQNLPKWSPFPDNCWVGVTVCNEVAFQRAMKYLPYVEAKVKYLSMEPMLGRILTTPGQLERYINWLIIGAQTKPTVYPKIEWVQEITEACDKAGIPVFHKDNLRSIFPIPTSTLRQKMPKC